MIKQKFSQSIVIPVILGICFFSFIFDVSILNPTNIDWLTRSDALQSYLGWQFYRHSPWTLPIIGLSPAYGLEISSSISYSFFTSCACFIMFLWKDPHFHVRSYVHVIISSVWVLEIVSA